MSIKNGQMNGKFSIKRKEKIVFLSRQPNWIYASSNWLEHSPELDNEKPGENFYIFFTRRQITSIFKAMFVLGINLRINVKILVHYHHLYGITLREKLIQQTWNCHHKIRFIALLSSSYSDFM